MNEKVLPETLLQLMLNVLAKADSFQYISGIQPFLMSLKGRKYAEFNLQMQQNSD